MLKVEIEHDPLVLALIESGWLGERESLDRHHVEVATASVLKDWLKHWLK